MLLYYEIEFYLKMISEMFRYMKSECHRIEIIKWYKDCLQYLLCHDVAIFWKGG